ncbi:MAG: hypothetical protein ACR2NB_15030 [Solirubrobacteraceae bacterium]
MQEILPGVWHWTAEHPDIHSDVSSYYLEDAGAALDPLLPEGGVDSFGDWAVQQVILTNRLHGRDAPRVQAAFGAVVRIPRAGRHHFEGSDLRIETYHPGDEIASGVRAYELGAISADDGVLHVSAGLGALHFADGLLHRDGELALMPDDLTDDPERVRRTTFERLPRLLELDFDALLFAHSDPITTGGRDLLADFVRSATA